ncbi:hypothetical protein [uncultured Citrobacter sp.]|uniref:hypothetical protein n=1 Tax=uncultured Citrobacter sp. TaxID=200446 RepID=UPI00259986EA|nr:hypothetical protein [uncultured Citrobacter sp.]
MFGLEALDVLIGLMTIYFVFAIAYTAIVEAISACINLRSKNLVTALEEFFSGELAPDEQFITQFFEHPLVQSLSKGQNGRPSYIPPEIVARVVEALVVGKNVMATIPAGVSSLPGTAESNRIKGILETFVAQAGNDAASFRDAVAKQFDAVMDRASGWYKRRTQLITFVVAVFLVGGGNIDSLNLARVLASDSAVREKLVTIAQQKIDEAKKQTQCVNHNTTDICTQPVTAELKSANKQYNDAVADLKSAGLEMGWHTWPDGCKALLAKVVGLLITVFAVSLGGPFWFDILQRVMQVRSTGPKPAEPNKPDSTKHDGQNSH